MRKSNLILIVVLLGVVTICTTAFAQETLSLSTAPVEYQKALNNSATIATKALPYIAAGDQITNKYKNNPGTVDQYFTPDERKAMDNIRNELHTLYALNFYESSYARDIRMLDGLYQASSLLHQVQTEYVNKHGTDKGLDELIRNMDMDQQTAMYLDLLLKLQQVIPSENQNLKVTQ